MVMQDLLVRLTSVQKTCMSLVWVMVLDLVVALTGVQPYVYSLGRGPGGQTN